MTTNNADHLESARRILNAPQSSIADLEAALAVLQHILAENDVELEELARRRKTILASEADASHLERSLEQHDGVVRATTRKSELQPPPPQSLRRGSCQPAKPKTNGGEKRCTRKRSRFGTRQRAT
jgi:hypothetical protein